MFTFLWWWSGYCHSNFALHCFSRVISECFSSPKLTAALPSVYLLFRIELNLIGNSTALLFMRIYDCVRGDSDLFLLNNTDKNWWFLFHFMQNTARCVRKVPFKRNNFELYKIFPRIEVFNHKIVKLFVYRNKPKTNKCSRPWTEFELSNITLLIILLTHYEFSSKNSVCLLFSRVNSLFVEKKLICIFPVRIPLYC